MVFTHGKLMTRENNKIVMHPETPHVCLNVCVLFVGVDAMV